MLSSGCQCLAAITNKCFFHQSESFGQLKEQYARRYLGAPFVSRYAIRIPQTVAYPITGTHCSAFHSRRHLEDAIRHRISAEENDANATNAPKRCSKLEERYPSDASSQKT